MARFGINPFKVCQTDVFYLRNFSNFSEKNLVYSLNIINFAPKLDYIFYIMPIPEHILSVERPKNTVVTCYGKNKDHYAVRQRVGCKYDEGRHLPKNGPTIGHIIDGKYVPIEAPIPTVSMCEVDLKDWANISLCDRLFQDVLRDLKKVYNENDALKLYSIAILRVCNPGIKDCELKEAYDDSFLSETYPDVALSRNTVCEFLNNVGKTCSHIVKFMRLRTEAVNMSHHLLVDGTLKTDTSKVNSLSDFSRKARLKGARDISVLYAFDLEEREPVCSKCYPGNMLDVTAYESFISENHITKGIIVSDKGFPSSAAEAQFKANPDLHYLNPLKRNAKLIERYDMLTFTGILPSNSNITYRKEKCKGTKKWLYSFRDAALAAKEEQDWLKNAKKDGTYSAEALAEKQKSFGTIVLESDCDLSIENAYAAYAERWEIEIVMRYYKSACQFDDTRVQDDYSVIGSEFCDFLATVLTFRLIKAFDGGKLLEKHTYKKVMATLKRAKKIRIEGKGWQIIKIAPSATDIIQKLGLLTLPKAEPKKRGRKPNPKSV